ncbi:MAG: NUDIX domain-containing protein [Clostridia bacterium]|nr:NUDIX domain-containing protein [Clostridia bacterium]
MARDVKFWKEDGSFKLRVCGILKVGDKYLISNCNHSPFWSYPGGHIELGEDSEHAVMREFFEETKIEAEIQKFIAVEQLFFKREDDKPFHEIGFYYLLSSKSDIDTTNFQLEEIDKGEKKFHEFKWVTLEELEKIDVRPVKIKKCLQENLQWQNIIHHQY